MTVSQHSQRLPVQDPAPPETAELTLIQVMGSVLAAGFGVQSRDNKVRDFSRGKPLHFIIAGIVFTVALLACLVAVVNIVI